MKFNNSGVKNEKEILNDTLWTQVFFFLKKYCSYFPLLNLETYQKHKSPLQQISIYSGKYVNYTISNYLCLFSPH